jgi:hypothetical protein
MSGIGCFSEKEMVVIGGQSAGTASIATYDNENSAADQAELAAATGAIDYQPTEDLGPNYTGSGSDH